MMTSDQFFHFLSPFHHDRYRKMHVFEHMNYPKAPDPSYGNTRPSVRDTPFQGLQTGGNLTPHDIPRSLRVDREFTQVNWWFSRPCASKLQSYWSWLSSGMFGQKLRKTSQDVVFQDTWGAFEAQKNPPNQVPSLKLTFSPLKMMVSNRNLLFQEFIFRGELLVSGSVQKLDSKDILHLATGSSSCLIFFFL